MSPQAAAFALRSSDLVFFLRHHRLHPFPCHLEQLLTKLLPSGRTADEAQEAYLAAVRASHSPGRTFGSPWVFRMTWHKLLAWVIGRRSKPA